MITFENPMLLFLLWVVLLQAFLLWVYWTWRRRTLQRLGSPALAQRLLQGFSGKRFWIKNILFGLALVLLVLAIANPRKQVKLSAQEGQGADIVLALDISGSMLVQDEKPNRLDRAKILAQKLVQKLEGNRIGLIFFAGDAYPQMPLSTDYDALYLFLQNASPQFIANQGTDAAASIELAGRMFESNSTAGRGLILITDGEDFGENAISQAQNARVEGLTIYALGVGTVEGGKIPLSPRGFKRDLSGQYVHSSLNAAFLRQVARAGGDKMYTTAQGNATINLLAKDLDHLQKATVSAKAKTSYVLYFQWLLLPCVLLLLAEQVLWWRKQKN